MADFHDIQQRETGLQQHLTSAQMVMIAIGGAVGTGLFMGSAFAIGFAGPAVLISYAIGAFIALLLIGALGEMTVAHPTSGSFGAYAEYYLGPMAGFVLRYAYWAALVLAVGMEVTAVGIYMAYWFPDVPQWVWVPCSQPCSSASISAASRSMAQRNTLSPPSRSPPSWPLC